MSGHILDDYKRSFAKFSPVKISDIKDAFTDSPDNEYNNIRDKSKVTLIGVVTARTNKTTRNGQNMAFVTIEDHSGEIELICFAQACEAYGHNLLVNSAVVVEGNISVKDDEDVKVILRKADILVPDSEMHDEPIQVPQRVHSAPKVHPYAHISKIYLKIPSISSPEYKRVMSFISIFSGSTPVIFYDSSEKIYIKDHICYANANEFLIKELSEILGKENVVLK